MPTDDEIRGVLFSQPKEQAMSDDQVRQFLYSQPQAQPEQGLEIPQEETSAISIPQRAFLSFKSDEDKEKILKQDFAIVQKQPDGNFLVGNDARDLKPISPDGMMNDLLGKLADHASDIPVIAGQLVALGLAPEVAIPARIGLSAAGAGGGQLFSSVVGGKKGDEIAADVAASAAFGGLAEGLVAGAITGSKVLAPKLVGLINKANGQSALKSGLGPEDTPFARSTTKMFKYLANVPEESTQTFFKYGMNEMNNPQWFKPENIKGIVNETVEALTKTQKDLGKEVMKQTEAIISPSRLAIAKQNGIETRINTSKMFSSLKQEAQKLGILDDFGKINKNYPNTVDIKPITSMLTELGEFVEGRYIANPSKTIPIKKALQLSQSFGQKFDKVNPKLQTAFYKVLNGDDGLKGLRPNISEIANKIGVEGYGESLKRYSSFAKLLDDFNSLNPKQPVKIEAFISKLEGLGEIEKDNLATLDKMVGGNLLKKWELWNAAQDFNKSNLNVLRFGAIAALIGGLTGFDTRMNKVGTIVGAGLLGTPAGLRTLIRLYTKAGGVVTKEKLKELGQKSAQNIPKDAANVILTNLLRSNHQGQSRQDAAKSKSPQLQ